MVLALSGAALAAACGRLKPAALAPDGAAGAFGDAGATDDTSAADDTAAADAGGAPPVVLVVASAADVRFVAGDGSARVVYRFGGAPSDGTITFSAGIAAGGGYVAASGRWWGAAGACAVDGGLLVCPEVERFVLLDLDGRVRWEKTLTRPVPSSEGGFALSVGAGGDVLLADGTAGAELVGLDGGEQPLPSQVTPVARLFAGPTVPVRAFVGDAGAGVLAWWRPGQPLEPSDPPVSVEAPLDFFDGGDELDFVAAGADGARVIVHARPGQTTVLPATRLGGGDADARSGPWRAAFDGATVTRFNLLTGTVERLAWALPDGERSLGWGIAADGSLAQLLRDDAVAALFLSPDGASGWTRVGLTMGQVEQIQVQDTAGTFLVDALGTNDFFVPHQLWPAVPGGEVPQLLQTSHQLVRPADGVATQILPAWDGVAFARDGRRAAYWEATSTGARLVIHDVPSGGKTPVMSTQDATPPQLLWLE
jgi:hypothetical protein